MPDFSFPKRLRLLKGSEFDRVFASRIGTRGKSVRLCGCENGQIESRLGLAVSRRVGNAVARNRWKRRLREAFRLSLQEIPTGLDVVVIPIASRPPELAVLRQELVGLSKRIDRRLVRREM